VPEWKAPVTQETRKASVRATEGIDGDLEWVITLDFFPIGAELFDWSWRFSCTRVFHFWGNLTKGLEAFSSPNGPEKNICYVSTSVRLKHSIDHR
jgi:hypothetical protein